MISPIESDLCFQCESDPNFNGIASSLEPNTLSAYDAALMSDSCVRPDQTTPVTSCDSGCATYIGFISSLSWT